MKRVKVDCPHNLNLSDSEGKALAWLHKTLHAITSKEKHKNKKNAQLVISAMDKIFQHAEDIHIRLHEVEVFTDRYSSGEDERVLN
jgi:hypothetical protein